MQLELTHFTDPAGPFAFSAEPVRMRLRWHYGDQLVRRRRMTVLTLDPGEAERLAEGAPNLQRIHGPRDRRRYTAPSYELTRTRAGEPLATAEVALIAQLDLQKRRAALRRVATALAAGADFYWTLTP